MSLKNKIPPPLVTLIFGAMIYYSTALIPSVSFKYQCLLAALVVIMGIAIILAAILTFRRLQTTVNPLQPTKATSLAISGIFRLSRNPMYLGMLLILMAVSLASGAVAGLLLLPVFIAYITFFQILPEEQAMRELFSDQYADYCKKIRRWI